MYDMTHHAVQEILVIKFKSFYLYECTVKKINQQKSLAESFYFQ